MRAREQILLARGNQDKVREGKCGIYRKQQETMQANLQNLNILLWKIITKGKQWLWRKWGSVLSFSCHGNVDKF